jgi:orotate phosphoribosyltransferase
MKEHGDKGRLVGAPIEDRRVLLVDDVLTAGTSMRTALGIIEAAPGARAVAALISVDRQEKGRGELSATAELARDHDLPVHSIVGIREAVEHLHANPPEGLTPVTDEVYSAFQAYWKQHGASPE